MKQSELAEGDVVVAVGAHFSCLVPGHQYVVRGEGQAKWVACANGHHELLEHEDEGRELVGLCPAMNGCGAPTSA